jgi:predicted O-methyltransferase YrrM
MPIPWLSPDAVTFLASILEPDYSVIEHGSGGSTLWFAQRVKKVRAVENDPDWQGIVKSKAPANVSFTGRRGKDYDLLLIDGEPVETRRKWLTDAPLIVRRGGWVVLDNANRPEYAAEREGLRQFAELVKTVDGNIWNNYIHTSYLVTDFWRLL